MLIRRKSSTDDEYHHEDLLRNFEVITSANGVGLSSNVYDAFVNAQYVANNARIAQPVVCYKAMSEPGLLTGSGGRGVVVPSRGFQVMGKKPAPAKKHPCKKAPKRGPIKISNCISMYGICMQNAESAFHDCLTLLGFAFAAALALCSGPCAGIFATDGAMSPECATCLKKFGVSLGIGLIGCLGGRTLDENNCVALRNHCFKTGYWHRDDTI